MGPTPAAGDVLGAFGAGDQCVRNPGIVPKGRAQLIEFTVLVLLSSIAVIYSAPRQLSALREADVPIAMGNTSAILQSIILCALAAGLGTSLRSITGFQILASVRSVGTVLTATLLAFLGHLLMYYVLFRPRLPKRSVVLSERMRLSMGLPARLLQGGIAEEVQFRWGLMSLIAAAGISLFQAHSQAVIAFAIGASAVLFAVFHLIGARQIGMGYDLWDAGLIIADNVWGGILFGWLFWEYGLVAAMASHALFHAAWFPIEKRMFRKVQRVRDV